MPKPRKPPIAVATPTPPRQPLTRERIADAALALIDEVGLEGFAMRPLGQRLGVEAMALYHHFPGKGELLDAVMDRLLDETELPPREAMPALDRLRRFVHSYRACAIRHPRAFLLLATRRFNTAPALALYERVLEAFADLGLDAAESARWFRLIGGFATGAGLAEVASRERSGDATPLRLERDPASLDGARLPHVRAVAPHLQVDRLDAVFDFGVGVLFDALGARAAAIAGR